MSYLQSEWLVASFYRVTGKFPEATAEFLPILGQRSNGDGFVYPLSAENLYSKTLSVAISVIVAASCSLAAVERRLTEAWRLF
jgi:hypothetical protein